MPAWLLIEGDARGGQEGYPGVVFPGAVDTCPFHGFPSPGAADILGQPVLGPGCPGHSILAFSSILGLYSPDASKTLPWGWDNQARL